MGSQTPTSNDRSRTYWMPTMERYFIDLMLDHKHRGNRVGHTFNKQAWTEMLIVFNARFGSQYDKDILKARYTNLWKQFKDIKNLLGQSGFSWDEIRQMVVAEDYIWDEYIKVHPDTRPYKTKSVLNFNDMCLIYGYAAADGRYSLSSHDVDIEDEFPGVSGGGGRASLTSSSSSRTDWTLSMDQYLIDLMLDQIGRGNKIDNIFNKHAWTDMLTLFNSKFGPQHGKRVLRHRYKKIWKYYSEVKNLLEQDGFSWDETQQMVVAHDNIWNSYIKAHPYAKSYRTKSLPSYNDLSLIYGDAVNEGASSRLHKHKDLDDDILRTKAGKCKDGQPPTGNERSRTFWTPPMDNYLIDLLLGQVYKGNKLRQTFISQGWTDMSTSFNVVFNSHHGKDVLKSRYKHLRRQFNDTTFLLDQPGFTWDETREMVTAEDNIWDAYTKEHPDARSYRVKTVPNYHKLCVIYGQESYDGSYSRLAGNIDSAGEIPVSMMGDERNIQPPSNNGALTLDWAPQMDRYFIDLMLEQVHRGNKLDDTFNLPAWVQIFLSFNERFGNQYDKIILERHYNCLMKEYIDISNILNQTGFAWDESQQIITASDGVWDAYIEEHPDATSYRNKALDNYNDLCLIFGKEKLLGGFSYNSVDIEIDQNILEMDRFSLGLEESLARDFEIFEQSKKRKSTTPPLKSPNKVSPKKLKIKGEKDCVNSASNKKIVGKNYIIMETVVEALQAIADFDDDLLLDACDLMEDERKAKTFLALDSSLRKKWLLRKLRP